MVDKSKLEAAEDEAWDKMMSKTDMSESIAMKTHGRAFVRSVFAAGFVSGAIHMVEEHTRTIPDMIAKAMADGVARDVGATLTEDK